MQLGSFLWKSFELMTMIVKAKLTGDLHSFQLSLEGNNEPQVVSEWGFNGGDNLSINIEEGVVVAVNSSLLHCLKVDL